MIAIRHNIIRAPRPDLHRLAGVSCLLLLIAGTLAGCGGNAVPPGSTNTGYGHAAGQGKMTAPAPPRAARDKNAASSRAAAIPFKPVPAESLMGLQEGAVRSKIGAPEMIRGEGDTRVWQYRSDQCSFDAFFFPDAPSNAPDGATSPRKLTHMLARMRKGNKDITVQDCLDQVVQHQQASR